MELGIKNTVVVQLLKSRESGMNHIVAPDAESQGDKEIRGKWTNQKFELP